MMTSPLIVDAMQVEIGATERWPDDVHLYQPYQVQQMTLPDNASCLSVKTFLNMSGLKYSLELRTNAEEMSPSGKVPFIYIPPFIHSGMDPIVAAVNTRGFSLSESLNDTERSELRAYMVMIENILVTKPRYGSIHPWPINLIIPWQKQRSIKAKLEAKGWADKSLEQVYDEVKTCCQALSERLQDQEYFFGDKPTELDAMVFGHLYTLLTTNLPDIDLAIIIRNYGNLANFCKRVEIKYFREIEED
ncbi:hypothetical protein KUTeg_019923 [Tegillarca granosa]|uniref:Metaxin-2 n=1 Tax=Tegillarca granosa TaxID=220873 RepID=A0ABQ9EHX0_TEGGR|nr:hypothetical protein KUTeg_019923 [Tegillarca granosa]